MTADLSRVNTWMYALLNDDVTITAQTGGRIYVDQAPQDAATPLVLFAFLGGSDRLLSYRGRLSSVLYLVRAVTEGESYTPITPIADRIDELLTTRVPDRGTIVDDTRITSCYREQPHQRKDAAFGVPTMYLGGFYRITFQPALQ